MSNYLLKVTLNGESVIYPLNSDRVLNLPSESSAKYEILDENQQIVEELSTELKGSDLQISLPNSNQPILVLQEYTIYSPTFSNINSISYTKEVIASEVTSSNLLQNSLTTSLIVGSTVAAAAGIHNALKKKSSSSKSNTIAEPAAGEPPAKPTEAVTPPVVAEEPKAELTPTKPTESVAGEPPANPTEAVTPPVVAEEPKVEPTPTKPTEPAAVEPPAKPTEAVTPPVVAEEPKVESTPTKPTPTEPAEDEQPTEAVTPPVVAEEPKAESTPTKPTAPAAGEPPVNPTEAATPPVVAEEPKAESTPTKPTEPAAVEPPAKSTEAATPPVVAEEPKAEPTPTKPTESVVGEPPVNPTEAATPPVVTEEPKAESTPIKPTEPNREEPIILFNSVTEDNVINIVEQATTVRLTGNVTHLQAGDNLVIQIGQAVTLVKEFAENGDFSVLVAGETLAAHHQIEAYVQNGEQTVGERKIHQYQTDFIAPEKPTITFVPVTEDNIINREESKQTITIQATTTNVPDGSTVNVVIGVGSNAFRVEKVVNDNQFSFEVNGQILAQHHQILAQITTQDEAGNVSRGEASHRYSVDTELAPVTLRLNPITDDNVINLAESGGKITISGIASNVPDNTDVVVRCGCSNCIKMAKVMGGRFSAEFDGTKLAEADEKVISARVEVRDKAQNVEVGETSRSYEVDLTLPKANLTFDFIHQINRATAEQLELSGSFEPLNSGETANVSILLGNVEHRANVSGNRFHLTLPKTAFADHSQVVALLRVQDSAQNVQTSQVIRSYQYDQHFNQPTITINSINQDRPFNLADKPNGLTLSGSLNYDDDVPADRVVVKIWVNQTAYTAQVAGKTWTLHLTPEQATALQGTNQVRAEISASDLAGNTGKHQATATYQVDTIAPEVSIRLNEITSDNQIDRTELNQPITISGQVTGGKVGENVRLQIDGKEHLAPIQASGQFSLEIRGEQLANAEHKQISARYQTNDEAGNSSNLAQDVRSYSVNMVEEIPFSLRLDNVTSDNRINVTEASESIRLTGSVAGKGVVAGQTVTLRVDNTTYTATVKSDLTFEVQVEGKKLVTDADRIIEVESHGTHITHHYQVEDNSALRINLNPITESVSPVPLMTTINGRLTDVPEIFHQYRNKTRIESVEMQVGDKRYSAGVNLDDLTFKLHIPNEDLASIANQNLQLSVKGKQVLYKLLQKYSATEFEGIYAEQELQKIRIELNGEQVTASGNHYQLRAMSEPFITVTGNVLGAKANDQVTLQIGTHQVTTQVNQDGSSFSVNVPKAYFEAGNKVIATVTSDQNTVLVTAQTEQAYSVAPRVSSQFVSQHQSYHNGNIETAPYFLKVLSNGQMYHVNSAQFGSEEAQTLTFSFRKQGEGRVYVGKSYYNYDFTEGAKAAIRGAFDEIASYTNLKFEETTNYYSNIPLIRAWLDIASGEAYYGGEVVLSDTALRKNLETTGSYRTVLHEISHSLGAYHTFSDRYSSFSLPPAEQHAGTSVMSYSSDGLDLKRGLQIFDLAFLHYRFGVNKTARAGDDVYRFKAVNPNTADKDIYIWDGGGVDTFDASDQTKGVTVDLTPGSWIYAGEKETNLVIRNRISLNGNGYFDRRDIQKYLLEYEYEYTQGQAFIGYGTQIEKLIGSAYDDKLTGNKADNVIYGGAGNDTIDGGEGNDYLDGGQGADQLTGGKGDDIFVVDHQNDTVIETAEADSGNDTVHSYINYTLPENVENITLFGTAQQAVGNAANNTIIGNSQDNTLQGMAGDDELDGKQGSDTLTGGTGADTFVFSTKLDGSVDTITDFNISEGDKIKLLRSVFTAISDQSQVMNMIQYDKQTGKLSYHADGTGAIEFAKLGENLELTANQFILA